ncbi:MAG: ATP-dependent DNA helicase RecQ [Bacteroidaceae bacterium]|nr:ATP-dependent DNA helicase RecQ [Bacteroidaceae bacterium]MEA5099807.1 ATP-dependent DNA helicase RecQ [Bacteroidales bacterium]
MAQDKDPKEILKKYWGYDSFRFNQEAIISSVLSNKDTIALLPTGAGKSLCYQLPALCKSGVTVVVSPLIALMIDQEKSLKEKGISSRIIYSGLSSQNIEIILNNCLYGKVKILYISPERISSRLFISYFEKMKVNLIAVDEAHCISKWGYDFRPSFLNISDLRKYHPQVPVLALTATATKQVVEDIQDKLLFRERNILSTSVERENLNYMVFQESDKITRIKTIIETIGGSGLIYVRSRKKTVELSQTLKAIGIKAEAYHAGLTNPIRNYRQLQWVEEKTDVMVATTAFGMGIDKQNVSYVIHYDLPESIEAYVQEVGRAGRNGKKAYGILLYNDRDIDTLRKTIESNFPDKKYIQNIYNALCNYYQIATSTGQDRRFDFDLIAFSQAYNFDTYLVFSSIRILQNSGLIEVVENRHPFSKVFIIVERDTLFDFMNTYPQYFPLLEALRRTYSGLMTEFTIIDEKKLAKLCYDTEENIFKSLKKLEKYNILYYEPKSSQPQLIFSQNRLSNDNFELSQEYYYQIKENNKKKAEQLIDYISSNECREKQILTYFDFKAKECGKCDVCLSNKKAIGREETINAIYNELLQGPKSLQYFANNINYGSKEIIIPLIRELLDEEVIILEDGLLSLKKQD